MTKHMRHAIPDCTEPGCETTPRHTAFPALYRFTEAGAAAPHLAVKGNRRAGRALRVSLQGRTSILRGPALALVLAMLAPSPESRAGGPVGGFATELTQTLNNVQLVALLGEETKGVALNVKQLATQADLLRTQFQAYENMLINTQNLPETIWGDVETSLLNLRGVMAEANALAGDGAALDALLRGRLVTDPLYEASPLAREEFAHRYDEWAGLSRSALNAALGTARMTVEDVDTESDLLARIAGQGRSVAGQVEAIQVGNELSASIARQLAQLRVLTAAQNEQTSLFQARWLAERDAAEAGQRDTMRRAREINERRGEAKELIGSFSKRPIQ